MSVFNRLDSYLKDSRNLKRIDDVQRRFRLLQQGKVDIVSFLSKLPKTMHDPNSLVVDVPVTSVFQTKFLIVQYLKTCLNLSIFASEPFDCHVRDRYFSRAG